MDFTFEPSRFIQMLPTMGKGMLGIFVAIGIVIIFTLLLGLIKTKK